MPLIYKFFTVKNQEELSGKIYNYLKDHTDVFTKKLSWLNIDIKNLIEHIPEFEEAMKVVTDSPISFASVIYKAPGHDGGEHIDYSRAVRVLFPIKNCQGSYTKFFDLNGNSVRDVRTDVATWIEIDRKFPLKEIASVELTQPIVFDSGVPHGVFTNPLCNDPRLTITVGFVHEPRSYLDN